MIDFNTGGLSTLAIAGIVVASLVGLGLILAVLWIKGFLGRKDAEDKGVICYYKILFAFNFSNCSLFSKFSVVFIENVTFLTSFCKFLRETCVL